MQSSDAEPLSNANIGIENDRILFVQEADAPIPEGFHADKTIDGRNHLAIPGLVNAHCHAAMTLLRGYADDVELETWLFQKIFPAEAKLKDEDVYWGTVLGVAEMIRNGTTCFNDMYLRMENVAAAVTDTGMRAALSIGPLLSGKRSDALVDGEGCRAFFKQWDKSSGGRIHTNMEIHSLYLYQPETLREGAKLAKDMKASIHIHILETETERNNMLKEFGKTTVQLAEEYGLLDVPVIAAHCVHVDDSDMDILRKKDVSVVHNATSNLKLASGIAPIHQMLSRNIRVCLGTDGAASNNVLNMFDEMHLAALLHKGVNQSPTCVSAKDVFQMATSNGAAALGFSECGTIEPGKKADITIINMDKPHLTPCYNYLSTLIYSTQGADVETVIVDGRILMENRELTTIDEEKAMFKAREFARRIVC